VKRYAWFGILESRKDDTNLKYVLSGFTEKEIQIYEKIEKIAEVGYSSSIHHQRVDADQFFS